MAKKKKGLHVGLPERFPTARERWQFNDFCDHEGLHKACAECTEIIEWFIEMMGPLVKDRVQSAAIHTKFREC